jgi:hypothetical protein
VKQKGLSAQKVQVTSSLRLVDIMSTPLLLELLKCLLPLNKLEEQLGLAAITSAMLWGGGGCCGCPLPLAPKPLGVLRVP